ncbi:hypothetical protein KR093_008025, partial [Drosophila rubida]
MGFSYVLLLTFLIYGVMAHSPSSAKQSPVGTVSRPSPKGPIIAPVVSKGAAPSGPARSYLPPPKDIGQTDGSKASGQRATATVNVPKPVASQVSTKRVAAVRPAIPASGSVGPKPTGQKPISSGTTPKQISAPIIGSAHPIKTGRPAASGPAVPRSTVQKPISAGAGPKLNSAPVVGSGRPI